MPGGTTARTLAPSEEAFDTPLSPPPLGGPATNAIPGVPGLTFPATDERLLARGTPASIGAFEIDSDIITVTNTAPATISSQPTNQIATLGKTAYLSVIATPIPPIPTIWATNGS